MKKNKGLNEATTSEKPQFPKRTAWKIFWWVVILAIIIGILVYILMPRATTAVIEKWELSGTTLSAQIKGLSGKHTFQRINNSTYVTDDILQVSISFQGINPIVVTAHKATNGSGETIFNIANLSINQSTGKAIVNGMMTQGQKSNNGTELASIKGLHDIGTFVAPDTRARDVLNIFFGLLPIIIFVIFFLLFWRSARGISGGGRSEEDNIFSIGKTQAKLAKSSVRFDNIAGLQEEKHELLEIVDYLKNPLKYAQMGARSPRGVILYGPPGTGKTLLAKAVAGEAGVPFFQSTGSGFEDMLVGVGAKRVRDLFNKAKKAAPCIIFIDEIDSVGSKRGRVELSSYSVVEQTLNQLLAEMDGFTSRTGVVVMAATNRLDVLDDALLRPGRFDRHIQINLPDIKEREGILQVHAKNKNLSSKISLLDVAKRTPGFSGAQLENVINEATLLAVRDNRTTINMNDIDEAIDRVIAGPAKKSRVVSDADRKLVAYHEAGHALVGLHVHSNDEVQKITIIPRGQAGGYTLSTPKSGDLNLKRKSDLLAMIATAMGGRAAEEEIYGPLEITTGASSDFYKATNIARAMVTQLGMSKLGQVQYVPSQGTVPPGTKLFSEQTAKDIDFEINAIIEEQYKKARTIIKTNRKELELLVEALLIAETILKSDIDYIHEHTKLPPEILAQKQEQQAKQKAEAKEAKLNKKTEKDTEKDSETNS